MSGEGKAATDGGEEEVEKEEQDAAGGDDDAGAEEEGQGGGGGGGGGGEEEEGGGGDDASGEKPTMTKEDVWGDDSDEEEADKGKAKDDDDASASGGGGGGDSGSDSDAPRRKKKDKKKKDKKERKEKRKRDKEGGRKSSKKRRTRGGGDGDEGEGEAEKEKQVFAGGDSDDEEDAINDGTVFDTETGEAVKADPSKKGKLTKRDREELRRRETQQVRKFIEEIRLAALSDKEAFREKKMATAKITMLPRVMKELTNERKHQTYLEQGVLEALKLWLETLDGKRTISSLPNATILNEVLKILMQFPIDEAHRRVPKAGPKINGEPDTVDNLDLLTESKVGHGVSLIKALMKDDKSNTTYRLATTVAQKWYRLVFKKSASHAHQDGDEDEDEYTQQKMVKRANREWEKMPENVGADGTKFQKGDFGFRHGASVPRPMLMDFSIMPKSKVDMGDIKERLKDKVVNPVRKRINDTTKEAKRTIVDGRNSRADAPELNRIHVGGVASKVASMGWTTKPGEKEAE